MNVAEAIAQLTPDQLRVLDLIGRGYPAHRAERVVKIESLEAERQALHAAIQESTLEIKRLPTKVERAARRVELNELYERIWEVKAQLAGLRETHTHELNAEARQRRQRVEVVYLNRRGAS